MQMCAKMISYWLRKVLSMAMTDMSLGALQGAAASATLVARVPLVSILQECYWSRVSTPARYYCST